MINFSSISHDAHDEMGDGGEVLTTLKLLIIGESGVGKSSLLLRFTDDAFDPEQAATIVRVFS